MSKPPKRSTPVRQFVAPPNTPEELQAATEAGRLYRKTAAGQVGCTPVIDAPLPLLAQFVVELSPDDRQLFLTELVARLPADALGPLAQLLRARLEAPAA